MNNKKVEEKIDVYEMIITLFEKLSFIHKVCLLEYVLSDVSDRLEGFKIEYNGAGQYTLKTKLKT